MERERVNNRNAINANEVLSDKDYEEIENILNVFVDLPFDELKEHERSLKTKKVLEIFKKQGVNVNETEIDPGSCRIAEKLKREDEKRLSSRPEKDETEEIGENEKNARDMYTTDLMSKEDFDAYNRKHIVSGFGKKVFEQFYNLEWNNPYNYFNQFEVDADLMFMNGIKNDRAFDEMNDDEEDRIGIKFEKFFPAGIVLNGWLGRASLARPKSVPKIGKMKHTLEYDDVVNHADYYTEMEIDGEKIPIAFDTTTNNDERKILSKLENSSSEDFGVSKVPFGYSRVKYCVLNGKTEPRRMPLFKIALDFESDFRIADSVRTYKREDAEHSLEILSQTNNKTLLSDSEREKIEEILRRPEESLPENEKLFLNTINIRADNFFNLKNAFFVSSEMFEQCELILKKAEKMRTRKVHGRSVLNDEEIEDVKKIRNQMWDSLCLTMKSLSVMTGAQKEFRTTSDRDLYERFKECAGVYEDMEHDQIMMGRGHFFGLRKFEDGEPVCDRCYVNMMRTIQLEEGEGRHDGRAEIVYKRYEKIKRNGKDVVATRVGKFREELDNSDNPKETARQIFSKITPESYMDNFEDLIEIAHETETLKIFLDRMRMGDFDMGKGILSGGYERTRSGETVRSEKSEKANFDEFIESLFEEEEFSEIRKKYLQGTNRDRLADCLPDEYLKDNTTKLISWGISDGRIASIIARTNNISLEEAKNKLSLLKESLSS